MINVTLVILAMAKNGDMSLEFLPQLLAFDNHTRLETKSQIHWKKKQQSTHGKLVVWVGTLRFSGYPNFINNPVHKETPGIQTAKPNLILQVIPPPSPNG